MRTSILAFGLILIFGQAAYIPYSTFQAHKIDGEISSISMEVDVASTSIITAGSTPFYMGLNFELTTTFISNCSQYYEYNCTLSNNCPQPTDTQYNITSDTMNLTGYQINADIVLKNGEGTISSVKFGDTCIGKDDPQYVYGQINVPDLRKTLSIWINEEDDSSEYGKILYGVDFYKKDTSKSSYKLQGYGQGYQPQFNQFSIGDNMQKYSGYHYSMFDINQKYILFTPSMYEFIKTSLSKKPYNLVCDSFTPEDGTICQIPDMDNYSTKIDMKFAYFYISYSQNGFTIPEEVLVKNVTDGKVYLNILPTTTDLEDESGAVFVTSTYENMTIFGRGLFEHFYTVFHLEDSESTESFIILYPANRQITNTPLMYMVVYFYVPTAIFLVIFYVIIAIKRRMERGKDGIRSNLVAQQDMIET